jgi:hypothetical protein
MGFLSRLRKLLWSFLHPRYWTFGSARHSDYRALFRIEGKVVDQASGDQISTPAVYLVDTGLDYVRSRDPEAWVILVGSGDSAGKVELDFDYTWGTVTQTQTRPSGTFEIRVQRHGYDVRSVGFKFEGLARIGSRLLVDIGTVALAKR